MRVRGSGGGGGLQGIGTWRSVMGLRWAQV